MANSFEELFNLRFKVENAAGVLKSLEDTKNAVKALNDALKGQTKEATRETTQAFRAAITAQKKELGELKKAINEVYKTEANEAKKSLELSRLTYRMKTKLAADEAKDLLSVKKGVEKIESDEAKKSIELARLTYSMRTKFLQEEAKEKLRANKEKEKSDADAEKKSLELARLNYSSRMKFITEQKKAEQTLLSQKQKEADNQLKIAERTTNQELALYRRLEVEKAKLMSKYGQIPASIKAMPIPMDSSFKTSGSIVSRQDNISTYRQLLQDAKLFSVEQNKLMQQEKQRTSELKRQDAELQKQLKSQRTLTSSLHGMRKAFQGFMTSSFVFKRFFDSTLEVVDEWSKMSVAMSQFRSSANFEDVNRQLNTTVETLGHVISKYEMIPAINKAKMLGFDFSNDKLSETLEMTTKIAQMFGMDATKAFGDFTVAISKASPIIMDNIGVLLRLEESYQMYYESQYKGSLTFDKFVDSLTQAQKRSIYYGEAMRLLQEKTEGVSVKTNEAQSVLMKLKDAWNSLGTDLEGGGGLNPLIWALEKVVSLAESVAGAFITIQKGYKSLQYAFPSVFGTPDVGFEAKSIDDLFVNKMTADQSIKNAYGGKSLEFLNKIKQDLEKKRREAIDAVSSFYQKEFYTKEEYDDVNNRYLQINNELSKLQSIINDSKKVGYSLISKNDLDNMAKYSDYLSGVIKLSDGRNKSIGDYNKLVETSNNLLQQGKVVGSFIDAMKSLQKDSYIFSTTVLLDAAAKGYDDQSKAIIGLNENKKNLATNQLLEERSLSRYNTEREKLVNTSKQMFSYDYKLSKDQNEEIERLKRLGSLYSQAIYLKAKQIEEDKDEGRLAQITRLRADFDPKHQKQEADTFGGQFKKYNADIDDAYDLLYERTKLLGPELKGTFDDIDKIAQPLKQSITDILLKGVNDPDKRAEIKEGFQEIWNMWIETSKTGAPVALMNNLPALITGYKQKESSTGRTKTPKDLKTGWYELNRDLYKDILPEDAIFKKTEEARLELFQKQQDLEKLKKDIAKTQSEGGKIDRNFTLQEEQKYVDMLTEKYKQVVELANEEYRVLMLQQTARQRAMYEFKVEKSTDYLTPGKGNVNVTSAIQEQTILNNLNAQQYISENKIAREAAITEEKKRISLGLQNELSQSAKEYTDTALFAIERERIIIEYKQQEEALIQQINDDYDEMLDEKLPKIYNNQKEFNDLLSAQANSWLKINGLYEKFGRRQVEITEDFKPGKRQAEKQKRTYFWSMDAFYGIGSVFGGLSEDEELYREQKAEDEMKKMYALYRNKGTSTTKKYGITETMFEKGLDTKGNFDQTGLETYLKTLGMTEAEIRNIQSVFEEMSGGIKSAGQRMIDDMQSVADAWKNIWQDTYRDIANVFGQGLWDSIINTSGEALWQYKDQRKESLDEEKKNLEKGQITKEQYLNRAAIIEKNFDTQKRNLEKQSTKETLRNLGSMFFFKGLGYLIEAPIKAFEGNFAAAGAYAAAGSALMLLGGSLGYASRGYRPSKTSSFEDEASAKQKDTNVYIDNRIFEDKRQMQKLYQSGLDMEV